MIIIRLLPEARVCAQGGEADKEKRLPNNPNGLLLVSNTSLARGRGSQPGQACVYSLVLQAPHVDVLAAHHACVSSRAWLSMLMQLLASAYKGGWTLLPTTTGNNWKRRKYKIKDISPPLQRGKAGCQAPKKKQK